MVLTWDTSVDEDALPQGWIKFLNIKDKAFFDLSLWEIKHGKYIIYPGEKSNLDVAIQNWTQIIPPESNFYIWASAKYTALDIIINAIFQRIFAFNRQISDAESVAKSVCEKTQVEEDLKKIQNDISVLKKANKELTQVAEKITRLSEQVKREQQEEERAERAAKRERNQ